MKFSPVDIFANAFSTKNRYANCKPLRSIRHPTYIDGIEVKGWELRYYDKMNDLVHTYFGCTWNNEESYWDAPSPSVHPLASAYLSELIRFRRFRKEYKI
jgi:hypothetical protein